MIRAAGLMLLCRATGEDRALFLKRGADGDHAGEWAFPGGTIEPGETAEHAAEREAKEEIGPAPHGNTRELARTISQDAEPVDFTTFVARVNDAFTPRLSSESSGWAWAPVSAPPEPLHPGCRIALARLSMNELDIARAIAAGELTSPQHYENIWLFAIRITGTGGAYRVALEEHVWRDPSLYLNPDFLARCNGLPVIIDHPKASMLNGAEFSDRVVGTIMTAFVRNDEVWGVARIYNEAAAELLRTEQLSTSPAVVFRGASDGEAIEFDDGSKLLIEGKPALLDHIAICEAGVWDKGGPPTGIDVTAIQEGQMADETSTEDKARKDAAADLSAKLDAVLTKLDSAHTRMDAFEKERRDETERREREDRARRDAARKDRFGARKDEESDDDWKKRMDADEEAARKDAEEDGDDEKTAADKARRARKDAETAEEKRALEKANEAKEREDKARRDAEEKERMEEKTRADSAEAENKGLRARLERLEARLGREVDPTERDALATAQARADGALAMFGERAPGPLPGDDVLSYRRRLVQRLAKYSPEFKEGNFAQTDPATLDLIEAKVYADAQVAAKTTASNRVGALVPVTTREFGRDVTRYHGDPLAWMAPYMRGANLGKFNRNQPSN